MSYSEDYFKDIHDALSNTVVAGADGAKLEVDEALRAFSSRIKAVQDSEGLVFFCGNGASCTMAEHMSHDFFQHAIVNTATCSETAHLTAISNDVDFEHVFAFRIKRVLSEKDILVTISSSGNSPNVIEAIKAARENGSYVVTFSGKGADNKSRQMGDMNFYVPLATYGMVESAHAVLLHACLDRFLDDYMGGRH